MIATYRAAMDKGYHTNTTVLSNYKPPFTVDWSPYTDASGPTRPTRRVPLAELKELGQAHHRRCPPNFKLHPRVEKIMADRRAMARASCRSTGAWRETPRVRDAARRGLRRAAFRAGRRPRHVLPSPRGAARPESRELGAGT